ncbi:signal transduction histidine kinase internal region [Lucifera butyrica]|uniref:histidine kinase n=1 Tax=Lucifera butyrica TaxID=1351585 RepID=A0A498QZR7_9FIRM|nr:sensor histidine kinase [Lucifera butyrica]VBB05716.1 signal transduction histidine kinase internal region [Lucifera butyrica]
MKPAGLNSRFADLKIGKKLIFFFCLLILVPVFVIAYQSFTISSALIEEKTARYSHDILYQTANNVQAQMDKVTGITFDIIANQEMQELLFNAHSRTLSEYEITRTRGRVENILASYVLFNDGISSIFIVTGKDGLDFALNKDRRQYDLLQADRGKIYAGKGGVIWYGTDPKEQVIPIARAINSLRTQKPLAYMVVYLQESYFSDLLKKTQYVGNGSIFIIDGNKRICSHKDKAMLGKIARELDGIELAPDYSFSKRYINGELQYISCSPPLKNGWRLVSVIPANHYQREIINLRNSIVLVAILITILAVFLAVLIARSISRPISKLSMAMAQFGQGNLTVHCPVGSKDEVGQLGASFNNMVENIHHLMQVLYDEQLLKRDAELKSLRMQINPHFLYNTLETINWMARMKGADEVGDMAKSLGDLMRATISGKDFISLQEELKGLRSYLNIQKYRYGDKFDAVIHIPEELQGLFIPKLIVQPIVENAICHGIEPALTNCTIKVSARVREAVLVIEVEDDGVGMTAEAYEAIREHCDSDSHSGIGINNVKRRITTLFGEEYGLSLQSEPGRGTKITIRLPVLREYPEKI